MPLGAGGADVGHDVHLLVDVADVGAEEQLVLAFLEEPIAELGSRLMALKPLPAERSA